MTTCPNCGSVAPESFGECPTCGGRLNEPFEAGPTEACPHCAEQIDANAEACPACGELRTAAQCARHADREAVGQCVICGSAVCGDCNHGDDKHFLCEPHETIAVVNGWAQVYATPNQLEAELIRDNLQVEGVDARVLSQKDHYSLPVELGDLSQVRVLVPAYEYTDAAQLLASHTDDAGAVRFGEP